MGSELFTKNGEECVLIDTEPFIDENGRMIIPAHFDDDMGINCHGKNMFNEKHNVNPNAVWHIMP